MNAETTPTLKPRTGSTPCWLRPVDGHATARPRHTHARLNRAARWRSALCAVHCMVMPVVLVFFPVVTGIHWSRIMDTPAPGVPAVFGLGGCRLSLRHHRDMTPLCLVLAGLVLNGTGRVADLQLGQVSSQMLIIDGPLAMAYGLWRDRRLCRCNCSSLQALFPEEVQP